MTITTATSTTLHNLIRFRTTLSSTTSLQELSTPRVQEIFESRLCFALTRDLLLESYQCEVEFDSIIFDQVVVILRAIDPDALRNIFDRILCVDGLYVPPLVVEPTCRTSPPSTSDPTDAPTDIETSAPSTPSFVQSSDSESESSASQAILIVVAVIIVLIVVGAMWFVRSRRPQAPAVVPNIQSETPDKGFEETIDRLMSSGAAYPIHRATWLTNHQELNVLDNN